MKQYTYLLIDLLTISIPFLRSFEPRIAFYKKWSLLFPAIALTGTCFVLWDMLFTHWRVWGFNEQYLLGIYLFNLPLEEILFFVVVPYACIFLYETIQLFIEKDLFAPYQRQFTLGLISILTLLGLTHLDRCYTAVTCLLTAAFLCFHLFYLESNYLGRFYLAYLLMLFPFLIINGTLTGAWSEQAVVWYNDQENLGMRLLTIPLEDICYGMLLILMNLTIYKSLKST